MTVNRSDPNSSFMSLNAAASEVANMLMRVGGSDGGIFGQLAAANLAGTCTPEQAEDLAAALRAATEHLRFARSLIGELTGGPPQVQNAPLPVIEMLDSALPLNRKERFYTGTVLPMVVASDGFAHLGRFLRLCGVDADLAVTPGLDGRQEIEFFTEYSFAESVFTPADLHRFADRPPERDVPDLLVVGRDWLLAVEAKVFHNPPPNSLNEQLRRQRALVQYLARKFHISDEQTHHVLLLPAALASEGVEAPVVTWENLLDAYQGVGPRYWIAILDAALRRYGDLVSRGPEFGQYRDAKMTGADIVAKLSGETAEYSYMGRVRGLTGPELASDIASGAWRTRSYEVRTDAIDSRNWFPIAAFLDLVGRV